MRTLYRIDDFQETYFVLDGVEAWPSLDLDRLIPLWHALKGRPTWSPATSRPRTGPSPAGDGSYHRDKAIPGRPHERGQKPRRAG